MVTKVEDPSRFGVVVMGNDGAVHKFVEKLQEYVGDTINAGVYVLSPAILRHVELRNMSIEKVTRPIDCLASLYPSNLCMLCLQDVFPKVSALNKLYAMVHRGYWMDVGQPRDFLAGISVYLRHRREDLSQLGTLACQQIGNVSIDPTASVSADATIGEWSFKYSSLAMKVLNLLKVACCLCTRSRRGYWKALQG